VFGPPPEPVPQTQPECPPEAHQGAGGDSGPTAANTRACCSKPVEVADGVQAMQTSSC